MQKVEHEATVFCVALQAMNEVAQRMQLRHPNIATVMGVATEPVTEDPLLVTVIAMLHYGSLHHGSTVTILWPRIEAPGPVSSS